MKKVFFIFSLPFFIGCFPPQQIIYPHSDEVMRSEINGYDECMKDYGLKHSGTNASLKDVAESASAECQPILDECVVYMTDNLKAIRYGEQHVQDPYGRASQWGQDQLVRGQRITMNAVISARENK